MGQTIETKQETIGASTVRQGHEHESRFLVAKPTVSPIIRSEKTNRRSQAKGGEGCIFKFNSDKRDVTVAGLVVGAPLVGENSLGIPGWSW